MSRAYRVLVSDGEVLVETERGTQFGGASDQTGTLTVRDLLRGVAAQIALEYELADSTEGE